ncbi:hypothetical protein [Microbulbifer sp. 2205BS26-8]|uniref:hypothetical protein n=1 Tax=Microbulbifer sp. 2205BS26-8 TaxID=3064386 RepID=UPI00273D7781|nr:hypothetical protein [Microbulbifer sp. 2205BS26-8]MDP5210006.1 hypothetical protein [Microbulbifer sp. 2205BS26-8]
MASQAEVAAHLFLSDRAIRDLKKLPGAPVPRGRGQYDLDAWRGFYIRYLRAKKGVSEDGSEPEIGGSEAEVNFRLRDAELKVEERAERIAGQRAKRLVFERTYGPLDLITHTVQKAASAVNSRLEALSPRLRQACPDLPPEAFAQLDREIVAACNELAEIEPDLSDYAEGSGEGGDPWAVDFEEAPPD